MESQETRGDINQEWNNLEHCITQAVSEALGRRMKFRGKWPKHMEWRNRECDSIKEGRKAYIVMLHNNSKEVKQRLTCILSPYR